VIAISDTSERTNLVRLDAFILAYPLLLARCISAPSIRDSAKKAAAHRICAIAASFSHFVSLQISKIATFLRRGSFRFYLRIRVRWG
jgi:hypothetical protein